MDNHKRRALSLAGAVGPLHHESPSTYPRRRFLRQAGVGTAVVAGAAVTGIGGVVPAAWAQDEPPSEFPSADERLLQFSQTFERAYVAAYDATVPLLTDEDLRRTAEEFRDHHTEHVTAIGEVLRQSENDIEEIQANQILVAQVNERLATTPDQMGAMRVLLDLEEGAAGLYLESVTTLQEAFYAATVADIQPVESQHAAVWGYRLGEPGPVVLPAQAPTEFAFRPADYGFDR